jgi:DoxX-like family
MTKTNPPAPQVRKDSLRRGKAGKIIYWIATIWLALGMAATGIGQLLSAKAGQGGVDMVTHLGYPVYLVTILGIWKILGVVALLVPKFPVLKEWAYAGFFFVMTGALFSHITVGDPVSSLLPSLLLLILVAVSWYFRPLDRRVTVRGHEPPKVLSTAHERIPVNQ